MLVLVFYTALASNPTLALPWRQGVDELSLPAQWVLQGGVSCTWHSALAKSRLAG